MKVFEVYRNGKKVTTAGLEQAGVMSVNAVRGKHSLENFPSEYKDQIRNTGGAEDFEKEHFILSVEATLEGVEKDNHLTWYRGNLAAGDEITIKIAEADKADEARADTKTSKSIF
ncbi:MAG: hypothetical protein GX751_01155 [Desulfuromonadaceae bacterium]|nr:hypothetical protein [Desulfuromonadaceae bacterium]